LIGQPEQSYNYSTFGYNLLGLTILKATNMSVFEDAVQKYLGINPDEVIPDRHSNNNKYPDRCVGYVNMTITEDNDVSYKLPGGGYMSTLSKCLEFVINLVYSDKYLTHDDKLIAWRNVNESDYGMGFQIFNSNDAYKYGIGHGGSQEKAKNIFVFHPRVDMIILAMSNSENLDYKNFANALFNFLDMNL
jgi:hypothetical protein